MGYFVFLYVGYSYKIIISQRSYSKKTHITMKKKYTLHKCVVFLSLLLSCLTAKAVPVHINSGNPAFPFPQFLEYTYGASHRLGNLGTKNAEGVVHAELEQDIRDAYQIHANEFAYTGDSWGGYKYIWTPYKSAYDCTEGDGYGLLAAAYMGDAVTFNGYWMCTHDKRRNRSKKYSSCTDIAPDYAYGPFAIGDNGPGGNTAADGDVDVALALYVAYKQWGEFMRDLDGNIVNDACGNPISYKEAMIEVIRGLVALSTKFPTENPMRVNSGLIGLDGYPKGGDTWNEQTHFVTTANPITVDGKIYDLTRAGVGNAMAQVDVTGVSLYPEFQGGNKQHIDYDAPAYFREFWELFEELGGDPFEIEQFKRGEASSDWLIGNLISKNAKAIPTAGWSEVSDDGSTTSYSNFNQGEDYRCSWRTISNHTWHGNPVNTWNPKTHKAESGSNTYEYDAAVRLSEFLNDPAHWNESAGSKCITYGDPKIPYSGPATLNIQYDPMTGITQSDFYVLNWQVGTGTFAAVSAQDFDLMGLLYRQCAIEWDVTTGGDCYLTSVSNYMHGWARHLGMMVTSGNYHAPSQMNPSANMKIYRSIEDSVTYCYTGDQIKFVLDYRNYGTVDAEDVKIVEKVPSDFVFVEASSGGVYDKATHTVTWNIGKVSGFKSDNKEGVELDFKSGNLAKTIGQVWYKLRAGDKASGRYCTTAEITCSNGLGWTTNEYPNFRTPTMQRNCVDVVARSLLISKDVDRRRVNDGNMATYTIKFENSSEAGWIDGGRPRVNVSFANGQDGARLQLMARLWNDAIEPYINYGNYRISYYLYDASINCYAGESDCTTGWGLSTEIYEGNKAIGSAEGITVSHENIVEGSDEYGKWNQRMCIQFAPLLVTTTMHVSRYFGGAGCRIHKGGFSPMRGVWALYPSNYGAVNWNDDWSWSASYNSEKDGLFYPVTPSWQKLDEKGKSIEEPVNKWLTCGCTESSKTVPNILVEEYDGYVWRRILGNGPMAGRDVDNVVIRDTLPKGLKFGEFVNECPLSDPEFGGKWEVKKTSDGRDIIIWSIPKLQVKQKGSIIYTAEASFPSGNKCETADEDILNYAWIEGDKNSPISDTAKITVTCAKVPEPIVPTTLTKVADKSSYEVDDDIEYTIGYKQTHGAIFDNAGSVSSNWTFSGGASASGGKVSISSGQKAEFKKIANNIYIETQWTVADDQETTIYFRNDIKLVLKNEYSGLTVTCYDGSKKVDSKIIAKAKSPSKLCVKLQDDVLGVWLNKDTATSASVSFEKLTKKDGYFGFEGTAWGNFAYSNIHVHTDYAYDLSIIDRVPAEVEYVSSAGAGTAQFYKGTDGDSIVWSNIAKNPIAFGDSFTVSWKGKVKDCAENIINVAYAKLLGHKDNEIMAQAVSGCGSTKICSLTDVTALLNAPKICEGDSAILSANVFDQEDGNTYLYEFFLDGNSLGSPSGKEEIYVKEKGDYSVAVSIASDPSCMMESDKVSLEVVEKPLQVFYDMSSICIGTDLKDNAYYKDFIKEIENNVANQYQYQWVDVASNTDSNYPDFPYDKFGGYVFQYVIVNPDGCASDTCLASYVVLDTVAIQLTDLSICAGQTGTLDAGSEGASYLWSDNSTSQTLTTDVAGTYSVVVTASNGCESHATATITVADKLEVDLGGDKTVCKSDLPYVLDATSNYDSFEWSDGSTGQTLSVTETGTYSVKVTQGSCSGEGEVTVTVSSVADPVADHDISYMVSDTTAAGVFAKTLTAQDGTAITYETGTTLKWYDDQKNELNTEPIPAVPAGGGNAAYTYYVSAVNADGCESGLTLVTVNVSGAPTPKVQDVNYCLNDPAVTALTADATPGQDAAETWTLRWYDASGTALSGAPTPSVTTAGETTYYVSQVSDVTGAESGKVPVKVGVYGVAKPDVSGNRLAYCAGEPYETVTAQSQSDATKYLMGDGTFVWTIDGTEVSNPTVSAQKESIIYTVKETYTISTGHVCESEAAEFTVKTTFVPEVTGDLTVNYLMKEGESGVFPALDVKNPNVAKAENGFSLVWYDTDGKTSSQTSPSPKKDPSWTAGGEQELRYYVMQTDGTCSSDTVTIIVKISDSPMPNTTPVEYCQNATATALTATINDDMESADQYTLVWYDMNGTELTEAPVPSTQTPGDVTYYVSQRHKTTGATSARSNIKVTVRALPVLKTQEVPAQCGGTVILSNYIKEESGLTVSQSFYLDATATTPSAEIVTASGTYYSNTYFTLTNGEKCYSEMANVEVTINDLSDLTVTGATTACPGGTVSLTATATSQDPGVVSYSWEGGTAGTSGEYTTPAMTGSYGQQFTYTVKASAGACVETVSQTHTVTIDKGVLTGAMTMNGETTKRYKTCGDEPITIETSHTGTDYSWKTLDGQTVPGTTSISVTPTMTTTYVLSLTNVCETSDTVTVEVHPLSVQADWTGLNKTVCEGDAFSARLTLTGYDASQNGSYIRWYKGDVELTAYADQLSLNVTSATAGDAGIYSYKVSNGVCEKPETDDKGELVVVTPATYTQSEGVVSCSGEAVEISVTVNEEDAVLLWSDDAMANATRTVAPTSNTEYAFTITRSNVCETKGAVRVDVRKNPSVIIEDVTLCEGGSQTLKATVEGDELTAYSWTDEEGNELGNAETLTVAPAEDARYTLTVTSASCGDASATAKVTVIELPRLVMDSVGLRSREFQVENLTSSAYEYKVDKSDWQASGLFENLIYDLLHTAYVRDDYGCQGTLMFIVKAPEYELEPYVTPDDDGVKDKWSVTTLLEIYPNANVIIYDRYGKQLVELKGSETEWDGTYNGHPLPSTDYWYTVNIPEIDKNYSGHFTLIRSK